LRIQLPASCRRIAFRFQYLPRLLSSFANRPLSGRRNR